MPSIRWSPVTKSSETATQSVSLWHKNSLIELKNAVVRTSVPRFHSFKRFFESLIGRPQQWVQVSVKGSAGEDNKIVYLDILKLIKEQKQECKRVLQKSNLSADEKVTKTLTDVTNFFDACKKLQDITVDTHGETPSDLIDKMLTAVKNVGIVLAEAAKKTKEDEAERSKAGTEAHLLGPLIDLAAAGIVVKELSSLPTAPQVVEPSSNWIEEASREPTREEAERAVYEEQERLGEEIIAKLERQTAEKAEKAKLAAEQERVQALRLEIEQQADALAKEELEKANSAPLMPILSSIAASRPAVSPVEGEKAPVSSSTLSVQPIVEQEIFMPFAAPAGQSKVLKVEEPLLGQSAFVNFETPEAPKAEKPAVSQRVPRGQNPMRVEIQPNEIRVLNNEKVKIFTEYFEK